MRKTLYFDKDSNDILEQMPQKKQSEFAREAVKFFHQSKQNESVTVPKVEVKIND